MKRPQAGHTGHTGQAGLAEEAAGDGVEVSGAEGPTCFFPSESASSLSWRPRLPLPPAFNEGPGRGGEAAEGLGLGKDLCRAQVEQSHERVKVMR